MPVTDLHTLVLDDEARRLGPLAVRLVRAGVDVFYTPFVDEARLLMRQEGSRVCALIIAPRVDPDVAAGLLEWGTGPDGRALRAMIVVGPEPPAATRLRLRSAGAEWALFEPFDDAELRFVVNTAVARPEEQALRREPRAPCKAHVWIQAGASRYFGVFYSLSARGGFVEMASPPPKGMQVELEFDVDDRHHRVKAEVIYRNERSEVSARNLPWGMGVVFAEMAEPDETALRIWCAAHARRYRL